MELAKCGNINCKSDLQVCQSFVLTKYYLYKIIEVVNYYITLTSFNLDIETHSEKFFFRLQLVALRRRCRELYIYKIYISYYISFTLQGARHNVEINLADITVFSSITNHHC